MRFVVLPLTFELDFVTIFVAHSFPLVMFPVPEVSPPVTESLVAKSIAFVVPPASDIDERLSLQFSKAYSLALGKLANILIP